MKYLPSYYILFAPQIFTSNQLLGTPINTTVTLKCVIEGYPKTITVWKHTVDDADTVIMNGERYEIIERVNATYEWKMTTELTIKGVQLEDLGVYKCSAQSSLGDAELSMTVFKILPEMHATKSTSTHKGRNNNNIQNEFDSTNQRRKYHQLSTPAMQKSTARLVSNKILTTTMDPRIALTKNKNALKHNEVLNVQSNAIAINVIKQISAICVLLSFTLR
ncbi:uncharacterized protein LOC122508110 [Leptopilina heterotoma]|uniref:uncharacterized protein LOC122508110 n=1 Tax=Leptopilina heterotoma TaxID=63436 RepID=UPI001CA8C02C|nr:uncharacterized protein LOC122508110 [Leptopilina heterotoma]